MFTNILSIQMSAATNGPSERLFNVTLEAPGGYTRDIQVKARDLISYRKFRQYILGCKASVFIYEPAMYGTKVQKEKTWARILAAFLPDEGVTIEVD